MEEKTIKFIVFAVACFLFALGPFILMYMWRPERLKRLEEESKLNSTKI